MKRIWEAVLECDDEVTGEHTSWACKVDSKKYGTYVWITKNEDKFDVEYMREGKEYTDVAVAMTCKSLASAKRWVAMNI